MLQNIGGRVEQLEAEAAEFKDRVVATDTTLTSQVFLYFLKNKPLIHCTKSVKKEYYLLLIHNIK